MYEVGSYLLYRNAGVCRVESTDAPPLARMAERPYYKLCPAFSEGREAIYVPQDSPVPMRPVISGREAACYLNRAARLTPKSSGVQNAAESAVRYQRMLSTGDPEKTLLLLKEIREKEKRASGGKRKLNQADMKYRRLAEKLLCEEFAVALHTQPEEMKERIYQAME